MADDVPQAPPDDRPHSMHGVAAFTLAMLSGVVDLAILASRHLHPQSGSWGDYLARLAKQDGYMASLLFAGIAVRFGLKAVSDRECRPRFRYLGVITSLLAVLAGVRLL